MKKDNKVKMFTITLITAIIMGISSITVYSNVCAPKFYDYFIDTGVKYLMDGKYEEAILVFNKAIEIEEKSTEARVYLAQGYVGNNEHDKAIEVLKEAQDLDITNEKLLKEILEILNEIDSDVAYEFLDRFINAIGKDNISDEINKILDSATESPSTPIADPAPGTYIKPISIKLKLDEIKVGHSFYYTTDGSDPNKSSQKYRGKIDIDKTTTIKLIGYNKNGESTEIITLYYIIDTNIVNDIENTLEESKDLLNNTQIGTNIGNTTAKAKKAFKLVIDKISDLLNKQSLNYDDASSMKVEIDKALETFKDNIIEPTDKSELKNVIEEAKKLHNEATEGNEEGKYVPGSKSELLNVINESQKVHDDILSNQKEIDNQVSLMKKQIKEFKSKINSNIEEKILGKFIIDQGVGLLAITKDGFTSGWFESEYEYDEIVSKRSEGNKIYYTVKSNISDMGEAPVYKNFIVEIELINDNTIRYSNRYGSSIYKLSNKYEFLKYAYDQVVNQVVNIYGKVTTEYLYGYTEFWGITRQDVNKFFEIYNL